MECYVLPSGDLRFVYSEEADLSGVGETRIARASHVEPTGDGRWTADMAPVGGPLLGPHALRSEALAAEQRWLTGWLES